MAWWWQLWSKLAAINAINILLRLTEYIYNFILFLEYINWGIPTSVRKRGLI